MHSSPASRRASLSSVNSPIVDKEALQKELDHIHTTASRSVTLTSFSDFDPSRNTGPRVPGPKDLVSGRISGLYSRLRQSVGASSPNSDTHVRPDSRGSLAITDASSLRSFSKQESPTLVRSNHVSRPSDASAVIAETDFAIAPSIPSSAVHSRPGSRDLTRSALHTAASSPSATRASPSRHVRHAEAIHTETKRLSQNLDARRSSQLLDGNLSSSTLDNNRPQKDEAKRLSQLDAPFMGARPERLSVNLQSERADSPSKATTSADRRDSDASSRTQNHPKPERPPLRVSASHLPNLRISQASIVDGILDTSSIFSTKPSTPMLDTQPNFNAGMQGRRMLQREGQPLDVSEKKSTTIPAHLKRRVISKEFWMKDENARDCFYCGDPFSTFRRKHHCRTCGQIFDAKCTVTVQGKPFGQSGTLRLCKPCDAMIYGSDDDSTVFTDEDEPLRSPISVSNARDHDMFKPDDPALATPSIGIPVSRRNREAKRRSAVIEFDMQPTLARPSSSRSLKSMTGRPHSSSHKRHHSRHQSVRPLKTPAEERGPFYQNIAETQRRPFTAFHNDNIIDPDLAPFLSDDGSDVDDQPSIYTTISDMPGASSLDNERAGFTSLLASAVKKGRSRRGDRSVGGHSLRASRDLEHFMFASKHLPKLRKQRNPSIGSVGVSRPSPRRSRSQNMMKTFEAGANDSSVFDVFNPVLADQAQVKRSSGMHGLNAPAVELNRASLQHVERLLTQLLKESAIPRRRHWQKALMPILLQCPNDVDPDVQNGDDMDIRNYIKIKKVPGGKPGDTSYISGVVFSKNIALKGMRRSFVRPRLVIISFAIEYARHNHHFMSLEPVIAQEREYLRNLVGRIVALKPQILLVQRNVSGLALNMLQEAGITVVYNIKESVLAAVARMTQTVLIKSIDKLSIDPSGLGQCSNFDVKTYVHGKVKKTFIWISGCQPDLGCTIVLRGAEMEILRQIKRITEFMCYVVYNLKLETCLMRDEFVLIPSSISTTKSNPPNLNIAASKAVDVAKAPVTPTTQTQTETENEITIPALLAGIEDEKPESKPNVLNHLVDAARHVVSEPAVKAQDDQDDESMPSQYRELIETARTRLISSSPFVKFPEPVLLAKVQDQERRVEQTKRLRDRYDAFEAGPDVIEKTDETVASADKFELVLPEMISKAVPADQSRSTRRFLREIHDAQYQMALHEYGIKKRQWESFFSISNNNPFNPFSHQNIFVLHSLVSNALSAPCAGPEVLGLSFYAGWGNAELGLEEDLTLGQFIEETCATAATACKQCSHRMFDHHRQYVHGTGQVSVSVKRFPSKFQNLHNTILMWSTCKICQQETTWIPMSDNSWKYSFGKYLELSFWSTPLKPRAGVCPHDIHKDFVRCFAFQGLAVRIQWDNVDLYDVLVPTPTINWEVNAGLELKNQLYLHFQARLSAFIASIRVRLDSINLSTVAPEKQADASATLEKLAQRVDSDHETLLQKLQDKYMASKFYEIIPLNRAVRMMDEKALLWDEDFTDFETKFFPSEHDIRRLATLQLKKLFLDRPEAAGISHYDLSEADEGMEMKERPSSGMGLTDEDLQSEKAQHMLTSVVQEHGHSNPDTGANTSSLDPNDLRIEGSDNLVLSKQLSPSEVEQAVEREDVKHLDLAVPSAFSEPPMDQETPRAENGPEDGETVELKSPESFVADPKPLNSSILERIEQMRSAAAAATSPESGMPESRIPRLVRTRGPISPPLGRTQSQPDGIPKRSIESTAEMPIIHASGSGESSGTTTPTPGKHQNRDLAKSIELRLSDRLGGGFIKSGRVQQSLIPRSVPSKAFDNNTRVSALAKHFEQLSREFERERARERRQRAARRRQVRANPLASSKPVVEVYRDAREAVGERTEPEAVIPPTDDPNDTSDLPMEDIPDPSSENVQNNHDNDDATDNETAESTTGHTDTDAEGDTTDNEIHLPYKPGLSDVGSNPDNGSTASPHDADSHLDMTLPRHEKHSLMKMLTSFWSERSSSGWISLDYPLHANEHVFDDSDIIVREDEPASVIALALSSVDYMAKLREFRGNPNGGFHGHHGHTESQSSFNFAADISSNDASQQSAIEASLISETGTHMKYSFSHNNVRATCKIFYAESFDALRRKCGVSERFVESLSRCAKWDSKGGKTKSLFLKTLDDRFVIKSLQEVELKAFTKFAPDYFAFCAQSLFHGVPSVIAKMFGLFQVELRNPNNGVEFSSYLLVMENLFYSRNPTRKFDLKGSMRNRKIESTGLPDEVLLDENLVETIFEKPLFVREHARKLLKASVWNDTMWLCRQNVMDYSLMAGFDDEKKELVVGIIGKFLSFFPWLFFLALSFPWLCPPVTIKILIFCRTDCIRTYTWDKKLESWIKDRGKNKPTITSPKDYRNRFRVSMMQYVLQAPTVWHSFLAPGLPVTGVTFNAAGTVEVTRNGNGVSAAVMGNAEGRSVAGSWEERSTADEDRRLALSAEGQVLDDATIREMSTMSFV
jgi:1-phosphatidylinositol-3-phosphate 5-kinase